MNPETKFYQKLKTAMKDLDFQRIETSTALGVPDVNVCRLDGQECWIELKVPVQNKIVLRKEQYAWGMRRAKMFNAKVWVAVFQMERYVEFYRFPMFQVEPRGKTSKYVNITTIWNHRMPIDELDDMYNILFTH